MLQRILIVDDAPKVHDLVRVRLAEEPVELSSAETGQAGIERARMLLPDLILLDTELPDVDGLEVCRILKEDARTAGIPIVLLVGASASEAKSRGLELGAADFVNKPFEACDLRARVRSALRTKHLLDLLVNKAMIDGLTGLWSRAYFDRTLSAQLSLSRRSGTPVGCVLIEVDHYKPLAARHGLPFADGLARRLAQELVNSCRTEDIVCRWGGGVFAVVTPNTPAEKAAVLAERLREVVAALQPAHHGKPVPLTCSIGIADATSAGVSVTEAAEQAVKRSKDAGGNRVTIAAPKPRSAGEMYALCTDAVEW